MSDIFPKFIIVGDQLYLGKVIYHKQLASEGEVVKGGGWFDYNSEDKSFTLHGDSYDFGRATIEDIQACIIKGNVGVKYAPYRYANHTFYYRDQCGEITKLKTTHP